MPSVVKNEGDTSLSVQPNSSFDPNGSDASAPKKIRFYPFETRVDQESSPNVVAGILSVFQIDVYALLDTDPTLPL